LSNSSAPLRRKSCALRWAIQLHLLSACKPCDSPAPR